MISEKAGDGLGDGRGEGPDNFKSLHCLKESGPSPFPVSFRYRFPQSSDALKYFQQPSGFLF